VRAPVKSAGVVVGRVAQIKLDPKTYEAIASAEHRSVVPVHEGHDRSILTSGLLGEQYVSLDPAATP
jgi:phospholipid/cholesterol/gamma-HCH transport system substrate-binding protein